MGACLAAARRTATITARPAPPSPLAAIDIPRGQPTTLTHAARARAGDPALVRALRGVDSCGSRTAGCYLYRAARAAPRAGCLHALKRDGVLTDLKYEGESRGRRVDEERLITAGGWGWILRVKGRTGQRSKVARELHIRCILSRRAPSGDGDAAGGPCLSPPCCGRHSLACGRPRADLRRSS